MFNLLKSTSKTNNSPSLLLLLLQSPQKTFLHTQNPQSQNQIPPSQHSLFIANLILNSQTLTLENCTAQWSPNLVNQILKHLWNDAPKALQFFKFLDRHPTYKHSSSSYDHAIDIAGRLRDYKTLWNLVARMRHRRIGPSTKTFAIIAERYVAAGKADRAVKIFLSMHEHGCPQDLSAFNTLLDILCKSKRIELAFSLFKLFKRKFSADTISYNIIANGWCLIKRTPKALEILKEMVERGLTPTLSTYNILLKGFFRAGQINEAWQFFLQMKKRGCELDVVTYTTVVHGFGVVGEIKKARRVFEEMIGEGCLPSVVTYNAFIQVLCKKDSVENALVIFEQMMRKGYSPNSTTYNVVIRGLCHAGEMGRAMEFMGRMKEEDECKPDAQTYNVLIRYFCDNGDIEKGLDVFGKMSEGDCLPNLDTYNVLISAMFVRKKSDDLLVAGKLLMEMVDKGFMPRKFTFNRVLDGLLLTGNQGFAKEILRLQSSCGCLPRKFKL